MAMHAHNRRAPVRALNLNNILTQFGADATTQPHMPLALSRADRVWIGDTIEQLIAILDLAAGDPDMEDGDLDRCTAGEDGPKHAPAFDQLWRDAA